MSRSKAFERMPVLLGVGLLLTAPAANFTLVQYGIEPPWLASAVATLMTMVAITLIVRSLMQGRRDRT
jgi:hypothetical protein